MMLKIKIKKKIVIPIICVCLGIPVLAFIIPAPIEGYWDSAIAGCLCESQNFLLFDKGNVYIYMGGHAPFKHNIGKYKKIFWNKYSWDYNGKTGVIKSGWIFGNIDYNNEDNGLRRNFSIVRNRRIVKEADILEKQKTLLPAASKIPDSVSK